MGTKAQRTTYQKLITNMSKKTLTISTYSQGKALLGKRALYKQVIRPKGSYLVEVKVKDFKVGYGKTRFHVEPTAGEGLFWAEKLQFAE